jgi:hypothetical protein
MVIIKTPKFSCEDPDVLWAAKEQLATSGITLEHAEQIGIDILSKEQVGALGYQAKQPALLFKYWDPETKTYSPLKVFHRIRLLGVGAGFAAQTKALRYLQPPGTLNRRTKNEPVPPPNSKNCRPA